MQRFIVHEDKAYRDPFDAFKAGAQASSPIVELEAGRVNDLFRIQELAVGDDGKLRVAKEAWLATEKDIPDAVINKVVSITKFPVLPFLERKPRSDRNGQSLDS